MKCPNCGIETNEIICPNCGANFEKTAKTTKCPNCGTETKEKVCPNCGANFTKTKKFSANENTNNTQERIEYIEDNAKSSSETTELKETIMCLRCGAQNYKQAEQCARCGAKIEFSPLESFLSHTPAVKIQEKQPKNNWKKRKIKNIAIGTASFVLMIALIVGITCCAKADFDRRVKEDLDSRFGDIELSQEEIDAWTYYLTH